MILDYFAIINKTDKSSLIHNYCKYYDRVISSYLSQIRGKKILLLEIGVYSGASLRMWADYFRYMGFDYFVLGIDLDPRTIEFADQEKGIGVEVGDQSDELFLKRLIAQYGPFDIVIDDGSHQVSHQKSSFLNLFPSVKNSGLYIVEDTCTSYWDGFNDGGRDSIIEFFKSKIDDLNFRGIRPNGDSRNPKLLEEYVKESQSLIEISIESLEFHNSTIIVHKR